MHIGRTTGADCGRSFATIGGNPEGAISADGRVWGTYLHGLFSDDRQRSAWLTRLGGSVSGLDYEAGVDAVLDRLAAHMEKHLDLDGLLKLAR
jgi:adenosylcobyric acid synthase